MTTAWRLSLGTSGAEHVYESDSHSPLHQHFSPSITAAAISVSTQRPVHDLAPGPLVVEPEQREHGLHVRLAADVDAHPSRLGQHMMSHGLSLRHELLANLDRERQVGQTLTVQVAQLASSHTELDAAKPMRRHRHARPTRHLARDPLRSMHQKIIRLAFYYPLNLGRSYP